MVANPVITCSGGTDQSFSEEEEDGEIVDTDERGLIPLCVAKPDTEFTSEDDDDEPPEEILNKLEKQKAEDECSTQEICDPKLCVMCQKTPHKYRCPRCDMRTCSVDCSKKHKQVRNCDGVRPPFQPVRRLSQFDAIKSVQDQRFLHSVKTTLNSSINDSSSSSINFAKSIAAGRSSTEDQRERPFDVKNSESECSLAIRHKAISTQERFLIQNALRRRIWLSFSDDKGGEDFSRHEQFSDTIFWCIDLVFIKQLENGSASEYSYRVQNIPETIRIATVLRQFLKPRQHGCVVSKSDLDIEKMTPFIEAGLESLNGFMLVPNHEPERYYAVNFEKNILCNLRNRVILNHPRIIITINNEFMSSHQLVSEAEAEEIREEQRQSRAVCQAADEDFGRKSYRAGTFRGSRGDFRSCRGGSRGGFSRNFRGASYEPSYRDPQRSEWRKEQAVHFERKRSRTPVRDDCFFSNKRGRGPKDCRDRSRKSRSLADEFDPFEPFEGPVRLPRSYLGSDASSYNENGNDKCSSPESGPSQENETVLKDSMQE